MHTAILEYKGYKIAVENYIYWLAINPLRRFLTMNDIKAEVDYIESNIEKLKTIYDQSDIKS
jgi:hypothetical protein